MDNQKQTISLMLILAIFLSFISPLIFYLTQKEPSEFTREYIVKTLNFELTLFVILIVIGIIPFIGLLTALVGPVFFILNLICCLNANNAASKDEGYDFPFSFTLVR